jgi:hypothetical protein
MIPLEGLREDKELEEERCGRKIILGVGQSRNKKNVRT